VDPYGSESSNLNKFGSGSLDLMTKNFNILQLQYLYLSIGLYEGRSTYCTAEAALEREHPAFQLVQLYTFLWLIIAHVDPNPFVSGSGTTTLHCKDTVLKIQNKSS
jgi:hypothetical protein